MIDREMGKEKRERGKKRRESRLHENKQKSADQILYVIGLRRTSEAC